MVMKSFFCGLLVLTTVDVSFLENWLCKNNIRDAKSTSQNYKGKMRIVSVPAKTFNSFFFSNC